MSPENSPNLGQGFQIEQTGVLPASGEPIAPIARKTRRMLLVEQRLAMPGEQIDDVLRRMYDQEDKTLAEISAAFEAVDIKVSGSGVHHWLKKLSPEILRRNRSAERIKKKAIERRKLLFGENPAGTLESMASDQGLSRAEIAEQLDISASAVYKYVLEFKVKTPSRRKALSIDEINYRRAKILAAQQRDLFKFLTPREQQILLALYPQEGAVPTQFDVARNNSLSRERVKKLDDKGLDKIDKLLEHGADVLKSIQGRPRIEIDAERLNRMYNQGMSLQDIAQQLGVSRDIMGSRIRELGFKVSGGRKRKELNGEVL